MKLRAPKPSFRTVFWTLIGVGLAALLALAFRPSATAVDLGEVSRGPLTVTIRDEARTRARELYLVSAPVAGRLLRVGNRAGEAVEAGAVIAVVQPAPPLFLDERSRRESQAAVRAAEAALALARAELEQADSQLAWAQAEARRTETLFASAVASRSALDRARLELRTAAAAREQARAGVNVRQANLETARARLADPAPGGSSARTVPIRAPASGRVLRVLQESEAVVAQGARVWVCGAPGYMGVVAERISSAAAGVGVGAPVIIDSWGGEPLRGRVRKIEPAGFLKVSALGVEEQRVNVIIDPVDPPPAWRAVGHGYRVEAAVVVWSADSVLRVPVGSLFRDGGRWAVFRVEGGRARLSPVQIGESDGELAEVRSGLEAGQRIVVYPGQAVSDGGRVRPR
ncbi:efflux RND transporter periplasmic adaptor subunit [Brevundimonas sp.]|uniref:efflux RND transporter periplasmic adaptor subunit n=1 Tax=Brevundimonas sp. TaxID=1871086 RepID=UPI0035AF0DF8